jgi:demethylmenaquinone methyltransferase/2-methoxy-6-polyprenyl-1,4-benzoquinol methylase/phosphoethanolamine N-methyltransferase
MTQDHRSDCWGRLNEVADAAPILTLLDTLPEGFREARRTMLRHLRLQAASRVIEAGCGPGTALADLREWIGPGGRIEGLDPTLALVAEARARAAGTPQATYDVGDIRQIKRADESFDAAFCDKILVHVAPVPEALGELVRVTRRGGRVGAVEWYSQGMVVAAEYGLARRVIDGSASAGALNPMVPVELESLLAGAGLNEIESGSVVAETRQYLPSLKLMLQRRVQQAIDAGAVSTGEGAEFLRELETRDAEGRFYWAAIVRWAAGTKGSGLS